MVAAGGALVYIESMAMPDRPDHPSRDEPNVHEPRSAGSLAGMLVLLLKLGPKLLSVAGGLMKGGAATKVGLVTVSAAAYSALFTWEFAAALIATLFIHEYGHVWAMRQVGMKVSGIYFIPLLGGAAVANSPFPSRNAEAYVAIMGPIWGFFASLGFGLIYTLTGDPVWAATASMMALLNLFNLLPVNPLDGGRIIKSIAFSLHSAAGLGLLIVGLGASVLLALYFNLLLFVFLGVIGVLELVFEWRRRGRADMMAPMSGGQAVAHGLGYVAMAALLAYLVIHYGQVEGAELARAILLG